MMSGCSKASFLAAVAAVFMLSGLVGAAVGEPLEDAITAYASGDYAAAMRIVRPLADQGNAGAQAMVGRMYDKGLGVPENFAEALKWFRKAADQGNATAESLLGDMYYSGHGVTQNYTETFK
jgi:TPR repeat protein